MKKINKHFLEIKMRFFYLTLTMFLSFNLIVLMLSLNVIDFIAEPLKNIYKDFYFIHTEISEVF